MISIIIVAGGSGTRMQSDVPKQFIELNGLPVIMHTIKRFDKSISEKKEFIIVLPENQVDYWEGLCIKHQFNIAHQIALGGKERFHSVKNGLDKISPQSSIVAIHDAVRPFVSEKVIHSIIQETKTKQAVIPVLPVNESLRIISGNHTQAVARKDYLTVQTPQCFAAGIIKNAYAQPYRPDFTDDASVAEANGTTIYTVQGNRENIKLTTPFDLQLAKCLLKA